MLANCGKKLLNFPVQILSAIISVTPVFREDQVRWFINEFQQSRPRVLVPRINFKKSESETATGGKRLRDVWITTKKSVGFQTTKNLEKFRGSLTDPEKEQLLVEKLCFYEKKTSVEMSAKCPSTLVLQGNEKY